QTILSKITLPFGKKALDNTTVYNLNNIINALINHEDISFNYADMTFSQKHFRLKNGQLATYQTTPCYIILSNDKYYLLSYSHKHQSFSHYRLDRMVNITPILANPNPIPNIDIYKYLNEKFNMNIGTKENIAIRFDNKIEHIVYDRLQDSAIKTYQDDDHFIINFNSVISFDLIAWIISFQDKAEVLSPQSLKNEIINTANAIIQRYQ
ncbi:MAG: WYL domain-containing protein, partial [Erysipelotrichaceae bacterium]|nr:WYL domain-containing protein [Erysipelotrichaceae bacterium]